MNKRKCSNCDRTKDTKHFRTYHDKRTQKSYIYRECRACEREKNRLRMRAKNGHDRRSTEAGDYDAHMSRIGPLSKREERLVNEAAKALRATITTKTPRDCTYQGDTADSVLHPVYGEDPVRWHQLMSLACYMVFDVDGITLDAA